MLSSDNPHRDAAMRAGIEAGRYVEDDTAFGLRKGPYFALPVDPDHASYQVELDAICEVNDQ